ncbi:membrane-associating domain protein [Ceratobasidium sp. AG-Ba]|nr:membrane-associating domain protein [Ceratobasidium sp. AG-Ba]
MALFNLLRTISFSTLLAFSLIVLGIAGHFLSLLQGLYYSSLNTSSGFSVAVSVITWAFILPIFLIGILRRGSFLSWVSVELGVCGLLWVLWLAAASYTTSLIQGLTLNCDSVFLTPAEEGICREYQALQAFSWLNWLILLAYNVILLVFAIKANGQGQSVWTSDINDLGSPAGDTAPPMKPEFSNNATPQPSMQQNYGAQPQYNHPGTPSV